MLEFRLILLLLLLVLVGGRRDVDLEGLFVGLLRVAVCSSGSLDVANSSPDHVVI